LILRSEGCGGKRDNSRHRNLRRNSETHLLVYYFSNGFAQRCFDAFDLIRLNRLFWYTQCISLSFHLRCLRHKVNAVVVVENQNVVYRCSVEGMTDGNDYIKDRVAKQPL
jgi:hypothetical protein